VDFFDLDNSAFEQNWNAVLDGVPSITPRATDRVAFQLQRLVAGRANKPS
jgi:hypothetical protein